MRRMFVMAVLLLVAAPAAGQGVAVAGRAGTLGVGGEVSLGLSRHLGVRGGVYAQPWEPSHTFDDVSWTLDFASPTWVGLVDFHPLGGGFRLTGGIVRFHDDHEVRARLNGPIEIGNQSYSPEMVGTLSGVFETRNNSPYAGLGFGRLGGRSGFGFVFDLGVAFHGEPGVRLNATGPIASQPEFQTNLAIEERNLEDDARPFRFYPVLSLGFAIGF